jgi:hypothetical protein
VHVAPWKFSILTELLSNQKLFLLINLIFNKEIRIHYYFSCHLKSLSGENFRKYKFKITYNVVFLLRIRTYCNIHFSLFLTMSLITSLKHQVDFCGSLKPKLKSSDTNRLLLFLLLYILFYKVLLKYLHEQTNIYQLFWVFFVK